MRINIKRFGLYLTCTTCFCFFIAACTPATTSLDLSRLKGISFRVAENPANDFLAGPMIVKAKLAEDEFSNPVLQISLDSEGTEAFRQLTKQNIGKQLSIYTDEQLMLSLYIANEITGGELWLSGFSDNDFESLTGRKK